MRSKDLLLTKGVVLAATISGAMMGSTAYSAQDSQKYPSCPDMSSHSTVLNEGHQKLESLSPTAQAHQMLVPDLLPAGFDHQNSTDTKASLTDAQILEYPLNTATNFTEAHNEAARLEHDKRFDGAYTLLQRLLAEQRKSNLVFDSTLIQLARVQIERGLDAKEIRQLLPSPHQRPFRGYGSLEDTIYVYDVSPQIKAAISKGHKDKNQYWDSALELLEEVRKPQPNLKNSKLNMDYALLLEWKGRIDDAKAEYRKFLGEYIFSGNSGTEFRRNLVEFCQRNNDFELAQSLEIPLLESPDDAGFMLLSYFLNSGHHQEASIFFAKNLVMIGTNTSPWANISDKDLAAIFPDQTDEYKTKTKKFLSDFKYVQTPGISADTAGLKILIPLLKDSEKHAFEVYLARDMHLDGEYRYNYQTIWELTDKKGWKDSAWETFRLLKLDYMFPLSHPATLESVAKHLAQNKQADRAVQVYGEGLDQVERTSQLNTTEKLNIVDKIRTAIKATFEPDTSECKGLNSKVQALRTKLVATLQANECLVKSAELDATGQKLESADAFADAEKMYRESVEIKTKILGLQNLHTIETEIWLARVLGHQNKQKDASALYEKCLSPYRKGMRQKDSGYADILDSYAQMLSENNEKQRADAIYTEAQNYHRSLEVKNASQHGLKKN